MVTDQNNSQVNSFVKGMNTDTSWDMIGSDQYVYGENIRITNNALVAENINSNTTEGIVTPVWWRQIEANDVRNRNGVIIQNFPHYERILACDSISNVGVVIAKKFDEHWDIVRYTKSEDPEQEDEVKIIFTSDVPTAADRFSLVLNQEKEGYLKAYIADGEHPVMSINVLDEDWMIGDSKNNYYQNLDSVDQLMSNRIFPNHKVHIVKQITGTLVTSQVQYFYRFYKKYGVVSSLSPLTNKIQVISKQRTKEIGNAENTETSTGFQLSIKSNELIKKTFDYVQVYRMQYIIPGQNAKIYIIYDSTYDNNLDEITIDDTGSFISEISIEEFTSMYGQVIVPQVIEENQNYMFASNIKDETVANLTSTQINECIAIQYKSDNTPHTNSDKYFNPYSDISKSANTVEKYAFTELDDENQVQYYGGTGDLVSWKFVTTPVELHSKCAYSDRSTNGEAKFINEAPHVEVRNEQQNLYYIKQDNKLTTILKSNGNPYTTYDYFSQHEIGQLPVKPQYDDAFDSSMFRSLRRDEVYRYGIIFYDKYGQHSDVNWIGDLRTPTNSELPTSRIIDVMKIDSLGEDIVEDIEAGSKPYDPEDQDDAFYEEEIDLNYEIFGGKFIVYNQNWRTTDEDRERIHIIHRQYSTNIPQWEYAKLTIDPNQIFVDSTIGTRHDNRMSIYDWNDDDNNERQLKFEVSISEGIRTTPQGPVDSKVYDVTPNQTYTFEYDIILKVICKNLSVQQDNVTYKILFNENFPTVTEAVSDDYNHQQDAIHRDYSLYAMPLGVEFEVNNPDTSKYVGFQIVRVPKTYVTSRNVMQCAIAKPIRQYRYDGVEQNTYSPYYPSGMWTSQNLHVASYIWDTSRQNTYEMPRQDTGKPEEFLQTLSADTSNVENLYQIFSPEILYLRQDLLKQVNQIDSRLVPICYSYGQNLQSISDNVGELTGGGEWQSDNRAESDSPDQGTYFRSPSSLPLSQGWPRVKVFRTGENGEVLYARNSVRFKMSDKQESFDVFLDYNVKKIEETYKSATNSLNEYTESTIVTASDVKNPQWNDGFTSHDFDDKQNIKGGIKSYKSFDTSLGGYTYCNWVSTAMYDLRLGTESQQGLQAYSNTSVFTFPDRDFREECARGYLGPGPICYLLKTEALETLNNSVSFAANEGPNTLGTVIANIIHNGQQFAGNTRYQHQFDVYYGFGNYFNFDGNDTVKAVVFDGDTYICPAEVISLYKAYDFFSKYDTLWSDLWLSYIVLETPINTFFDYGMNYRNTQNSNVQIEPTKITGVTAQDRPAYQYNQIYSDNNASNDMFNAVQDIRIKNEVIEQENIFKQRTFYSELKTNGESIDNWHIYKAANFIDCDSKYGEITNLLTHKDVIFFWQNKAFGRYSVNERSLVTDNNSNTVQLGQGGVLQRTDYLDTHYGMRPHEFCAVSTPAGIFWNDIENKAVVQYSNAVVNYGEHLNVQNLINENITDELSHIGYDLQNDELFCNIFGIQSLIFNTKYNMATSVYSNNIKNERNILYFNNVAYVIEVDLSRVQLNYINDATDSGVYKLNSKLSFVVNKGPSQTKVFDNQKVVTLYRDTRVDHSMDDDPLAFNFSFATDSIPATTSAVISATSDREKNIQYAIPRYDNQGYGQRMRGKWMRVDITDADLSDSENNKYYGISHVITKFRQSYS